MEKITKISKREGWLLTIIFFVFPIVIKPKAIIGISLVFATWILFSYTRRVINFKISLKEVLKMFGIILVALFFLNLWGVLAQKFIGIDSVSQNQKGIENELQKGGWNSAIMLFFVLITAPLIEELFFRGFVQEYAGRGNKKIGFLLSWVIFAAIHLIASMKSGAKVTQLLIEFVPYLSLSFILCWYYYKHENIGKNIIFHFIWNLIGSIAMFLPIILG